VLYKCSGSTEEQTDLSFLLHVCDLSDTLPAVTDQTVVCDGILHCLRHLVFYVFLEQNTRKHTTSLCFSLFYKNNRFKDCISLTPDVINFTYNACSYIDK